MILRTTHRAMVQNRHSGNRLHVPGQGSAEGLPPALTSAPKDGSLDWASSAVPLVTSL